jgi:hypothetical protein
MGLVTIFYCLRFETSLFVASYDSQGYGGGIRTRLHTGVNCQLLLTTGYIASGRTTQITHPLPSNGCPLLLRIRCRGMCLLSRCLAIGLCLRIIVNVYFLITWYQHFLRLKIWASLWWFMQGLSFGTYDIKIRTSSSLKSAAIPVC